MGARPLALIRALLAGRRGCGCDTCPLRPGDIARTVLLFGSPNVGKSLIFNRLTGSYAIVSNYPGTTVEVTRGRGRIGDVALQVVDTPGAYSLLPLSEDERVARSLLLEESPHLVLHVADAKNLSRMLPLTLQLIEAGLPVALDLNLMDEAQRAGVSVSASALHHRLGIPVVLTAAATGFGIERLRALLAGPPPSPSPPSIIYPEPVASAARQIEALLKGDYRISRRAVALLLLARDPDMRERVRLRDPQALPAIDDIVQQAQARRSQPLSVVIALARQRAAELIAREVVTAGPTPLRRSFAEVLGDLAMHPLAGIPILLAVLYLGLYLVVGKLAAGLLVNLLDRQLFVNHLNPALDRIVAHLLPWPVLSLLFVGQYGLLTLGLRYALAIVLPLVAAFFLIFALLEDSGYLPRLALLVDRLFKRIGLSGRAVIPIVLGLGCDTMATLVTRILPTRRERVIATFLLALAVPCSAQLGVILGLLAAHPLGLAIWAGVVLAVFLISGLLAARLLPGETGRFYLEIPPLRLPSLRNVAAKTLARLKWYGAEVIPLFLFASVLLWLGELTHLFQLALVALRPVVHAIGLPASAADAFLFGFFRRDYGAARIFDIHSAGAISGVPLVVAMVTITLFIPCIAQFLVMQKERGLRAALAVSAVILVSAFGVGYLLNLALTHLKVTM
jgi:ferrous iron transport protein B